MYIMGFKNNRAKKIPYFFFSWLLCMLAETGEDLRAKCSKKCLRN